MSDTLQQLWHSTADLYARFSLDAVSVPPGKRRKYLLEEIGELIEAVTLIQYSGDGSVTDVCDEAADVFVTVCGYLQALNIDFADFAEGCQRVRAKNDNKTVENGYAFVNGKISQAAANPVAALDARLRVVEVTLAEQEGGK